MGAPFLTATSTFVASAEPLTTASGDLAIKSRRDAVPMPYLDIEKQAQALGSIFLSIMWTDLGQSHQSHNILESPELLREFSHDLTSDEFLRVKTKR